MLKRLKAAHERYSGQKESLLAPPSLSTVIVAITLAVMFLGYRHMVERPPHGASRPVNLAGAAEISQQVTDDEHPVYLEHKGRKLKLVGPQADCFLKHHQQLGRWMGEEPISYRDKPGLGYVGIYISFKTGVLVIPIEYEPYPLSHAEFKIRLAQKTPPTTT